MIKNNWSRQQQVNPTACLVKFTSNIQRAMNFELVVSDQLFSVLLVSLQLVQNSATSVAWRRQCDIGICKTPLFIAFFK